MVYSIHAQAPARCIDPAGQTFCCMLHSPKTLLACAIERAKSSGAARRSTGSLAVPDLALFDRCGRQPNSSTGAARHPPTHLGPASFMARFIPCIPPRSSRFAACMPIGAVHVAVAILHAWSARGRVPSASTGVCVEHSPLAARAATAGTSPIAPGRCPCPCGSAYERPTAQYWLAGARNGSTSGMSSSAWSLRCRCFFRRLFRLGRCGMGLPSSSYCTSPSSSSAPPPPPRPLVLAPPCRWCRSGCPVSGSKPDRSCDGTQPCPESHSRRHPRLATTQPFKR